MLGAGLGESSPVLISQIKHRCFVILNDGSYTRIPGRSDQRPSAIDLTFASAGGVGWEVGVDIYPLLRSPSYNHQHDPCG